MSEFQDMMRAEQEHRNTQAREADVKRQEAEEALRGFMDVMVEYEVGKLVMYREAVRPVYREEGIWRPRQVDTGAKKTTLQEVGEGWPTGIYDGNDYTPKQLAVLDNGNVYWAQHVLPPGERSWRFLIGENDRPFPYSPFGHPTWRKALASKALDITIEKQGRKRG